MPQRPSASNRSPGNRSPGNRSSRTPRKLSSSQNDQSDQGGTALGNRAEGSRPSQTTAAGLHLVATPIGNLRDITLRALDTLRDADIIACEDTRVTRKLLTAHSITTPLTAYHEHNAARARPALIKRLELGQIVALVSDAGMPAISDPGYRLVREAAQRGLWVSVVPGASAPLAGLVLSGLPTDRFHFAGYPPPRQAARRSFLAGLAGIDATLVLLESPRRLAASLADMADVLGNREAAVAREITKLYEEVVRDTLVDLAGRYAASGPPKGEIVLVVAPPDAPAEASADRIDTALRGALATMSVRDAAATVAAATDAPRRVVYERALAIERGDQKPERSDQKPEREDGEP